MENAIIDLTRDYGHAGVPVGPFMGLAVVIFMILYVRKKRR